MVMQVREQVCVVWLSMVCAVAFTQEQSLMELMEFLGEWTDVQGEAIDFDMFDDGRKPGSSLRSDSRLPDVSDLE